MQDLTGQHVPQGYLDQGYTGAGPAEAAAAHGIRLEVIKHTEAKRGFILLPRRWVVERSFAWPGRVATGRLSRRVTVTARNEVGHLAEAIDAITTQLSESIAQLTKTTRPKQCSESESCLAHDNLIGILPKSLPALSFWLEVHLHAGLTPARKANGDFYDFTMADDRELFLVAGEVSGKDRPAAPFIAVSHTTCRATVAPGICSIAILNEMNLNLCAEVRLRLFVADFRGHFVVAGEVADAIGGHMPPCLIGQGGTIEHLPSPGQPRDHGDRWYGAALTSPSGGQASSFLHRRQPSNRLHVLGRTIRGN